VVLNGKKAPWGVRSVVKSRLRIFNSSYVSVWVH